MIWIDFELEPIRYAIYMLLRISIKPQRCYTNVKIVHHQRSNRVLDRIRNDPMGWVSAGTHLHCLACNVRTERQEESKATGFAQEMTPGGEQGVGCPAVDLTYPAGWWT